jgi:ABC-type Fe3+-hydroxamate transport system substrate-binding protein
MKLYALLMVVLLSGCSTTVPVVAKFPEAPKSLTENCSPLKKIEGDTVSIVDLHKVVVENYTTHHECAVKVEGWNEWYVKQKQIFEEIK